MKKISKNPSEEDLLKFCLIPEQHAPFPKPTSMSSDSLYFTSPSRDLRFFGGLIPISLNYFEI